MAARRRSLSELGTAFGEAGVYFPTGAAGGPRVWSCGIDPVDVVTGVGGIPEGRVIVAHGPQSSGKTTFVGHLAKEVLDAGGYVIYMDHERKLSEAYYARMGIDFSCGRFIVANPRYIEEGFAMIARTGEKIRKEWGETEAPILVVWDSIHAIVAKRRFEKDFDEGNYSPEAAAYNDGFKKIVPIISDHRIISVFISQVRVGLGGFKPVDKIGIGNAVVHAASIVLQFKKPSALGRVGIGQTGNLCKIVVVKNQMANPWTHCEFPLHFHDTEDHPAGIDRAVCLMTAAKMVGFAAKNGMMSFETPDGQEFSIKGLPGVTDFMANYPKEFLLLRKEVVAKTVTAKLHRIVEQDPEAETVAEEAGDE